MKKMSKMKPLQRTTTFETLKIGKENTFASRLSPKKCKTMFKLICKAIKTEKQTLGKNEIESFEQ